MTGKKNLFVTKYKSLRKCTNITQFKRFHRHVPYSMLNQLTMLHLIRFNFFGKYETIRALFEVKTTNLILKNLHKKGKIKNTFQYYGF